MKTSCFSKLYIIMVLLVMYLPVFVLVLLSFNESKTGIFTGFTLQWYEALLANTRLHTSLKNSLILAIYSCVGAAVIGMGGAVAMSKWFFRGKGFLENLSLIPIMIPEIILGMAYLASFTLLQIPLGMFAMTLAHITFCIPYVYINVKARLSGMDPSIEEAALDLGATPRRVFFDITLPLIAPAVLGGVLIAFAMSMDDIIISFFLNSPQSNTLPIQVTSMLRFGISPEINAICSFMLAVVLLAILIYRLFAYGKSRMDKKRLSGGV